MQTRPPSDPALARTSRRLADPHASVDTVLVALASCFSWCSEPVLLERLDDASRLLFPLAEAGPSARAQGLTRVVQGHLGLRPDPTRADTVLLDRALATGRANPLLVAAVGHEVARRAGWPAGIGTTADRWWTALPAEGTVLLVGAAHPDDPPLTAPLRCHCPHEVAAAALRVLAAGGGEPGAVAVRLLTRLPLRPCSG